MTLDEAITHAEEVAYRKDLESEFETNNERYAMTDKEREECKACADEHYQLAGWLRELKAYRKMYRKVYVDDCLRAESEEL